MSQMKKRELILPISFGIVAIMAGLIIIITGELGLGIGDTVTRFDGMERLYGIWPIIIGVVFISLFVAKYKSSNKKISNKEENNI